MSFYSFFVRKGGIMFINFFELFEIKIMECEEFKVNLVYLFLNRLIDE